MVCNASSRTSWLTLLLVCACTLWLLPARLPAATADTLTAHVLTPDKTPVQGALVRWIGRDKRGYIQLTQATTDAAGAFHFPNSGKLLAQYRYVMLATKVDGWGLSFARITPANPSPDITLQPATELQAPFIDPAGQPVAGMRVTVQYLSGEQSGSLMFCKELTDAFVGVTDARGVCTIPGLTQGMQAMLAVADERYAQLTYPQIIKLDTAAVTQAKPISLLPASSLRGRITYAATGKPVAGLHVNAWSPRGGSGEAVTDADGKYVVGQLSPTTYNVGVELSTEQSKLWTSPGRSGIQVPMGQSVDGIDLTLITGALLTGKVTDAATHKPISGVSIYVDYGNNTWSQNVETDQAGMYLLHIPPGAIYMNLSKLPAGYVMPVRQDFRFTAGDGENISRDITLSLSKVKAVHGRVLGPDGKPVADAEVFATPLASEHYASGGTTKTDANGAFTLDPRGYGVSVGARSGNMATVQDTPLPLGGEVTLRLAKDVLCTLTGLVTDETGEPIAGVRVTLSMAGQSRQIPPAITDKTGHYKFTALWPGKEFSLEATADGYGIARSNGMEQLTGKANTAGELLLNKIDSYIAGKVVDEHGKPLAGMSIYLNSQLMPYTEQATDAEGCFRFAAISGEKVSLTVNTPGGETTETIGGIPLSNVTKEITVNGQADVVMVVKTGK